MQIVPHRRPGRLNAREALFCRAVHLGCWFCSGGHVGVHLRNTWMPVAFMNYGIWISVVPFLQEPPSSCSLKNMLYRFRFCFVTGANNTSQDLLRCRRLCSISREQTLSVESKPSIYGQHKNPKHSCASCDPDWSTDLATFKKPASKSLSCYLCKSQIGIGHKKRQESAPQINPLRH